jgi:hypothetical protein
VKGHPKSYSNGLLAATKESLLRQFPKLNEKELNLLARVQLLGVLTTIYNDPKISAVGEELRASVHEYLCSMLNHGQVSAWQNYMDRQLQDLITKVRGRK